MNTASSTRTRRRARVPLAIAVLVLAALASGACRPRPDPPAAERLVGTWYVYGFASGSTQRVVPPGPGGLRLTFAATGTLRLDYGCDEWETTWAVENGRLAIPRAFALLPREHAHACNTDSDRIDDELAAVVPSATAFDRSGDSLSLLARPGGRVLVTARTTPVPSGPAAP